MRRFLSSRENKGGREAVETTWGLMYGSGMNGPNEDSDDEKNKKPAAKSRVRYCEKKACAPCGHYT
jgi:hypothetical protein